MDNKPSYKRRFINDPHTDAQIVTREDRLKNRDRSLLVRYYYWTEIKRRRFDDVTMILANNEFFIDQRTVQNKLIDYDEFYKELCAIKPNVKELAKDYPTWSWC